MDPDKEEPRIGLMDRLMRPAAVVGAFAGFITAAFRRANPGAAPRKARPAAAPRPEQLFQLKTAALELPRRYSRTAVIGGANSAHPFRQSLTGVAVGSTGRIYVLGDDEVRIFESDGKFVQGWPVLRNASGMALAADGRVYVGAAGVVDIYSSDGSRSSGFAAGDTGKPAVITAIKVFKNEILIADADARVIRRYDAGGRQLGLIGASLRSGGFMLPNRRLDFDVDAGGIVRATDPGRHLVTTWNLQGQRLGFFGKFGMSDPADFVGCCNPVNIAVTPDGKIVTAEKMVARVKVYEPEGKLLAVIGPENFDPNCLQIHLAVDSRGRILAGDTVRREVKIFSPDSKPAPAGLSRKPEEGGLP